MNTIKDILIGLGAAGAAFIMLGINEAIIKPNAVKFTQRNYKHLKGYVQPTLNKLDEDLSYVKLANFIDDAILPPELSDSDKAALLAMIVKEFSLEAHLNKTKQS